MLLVKPPSDSSERCAVNDLRAPVNGPRFSVIGSGFVFFFAGRYCFIWSSTASLHLDAISAVRRRSRSSSARSFSLLSISLSLFLAAAYALPNHGGSSLG